VNNECPGGCEMVNKDITKSKDIGTVMEKNEEASFYYLGDT
jgi:hypothetical protein